MFKQILTKKKIICVLAGILLVLIVWTAWGNTALERNTYTISSRELPDAFDGYRIAQVSDLHNAEFGEGNQRLLKMLREAEPDMIAITGDLIDSRKTNIVVALAFAKEAVKIAPCYYVSGNHEARVSEYQDLKTGLEEAGVTVLDDAQVKIEVSGESITVIGVNDPSFHADYLTSDAEVMDRKLSELSSEDAGFTLLLSHRPELFDAYVAHDMDLVLTGHAHGGQFRLPLIGGLIAPNQGLFPKYDAGLYSDGSTNMIVSRGLGNSIIPFRFNNRPEVVLIELKGQN
mgnify:FL=1